MNYLFENMLACYGIYLPKQCKQCGKEFNPRLHNQIMCSSSCRKDYLESLKSQWDDSPRQCKQCGKEFNPRFSVQIYCSQDCRVNYHIRADINKYPQGKYVYVWYDDAEPFYVGEGTGDRAWEPHIFRYEDRLQQCEIVRNNSSNFRVEIIRDNLTKEGALLLESTFIEYFRKQGYALANRVNGIQRQEKPPLIPAEIH
ncbi:MAG: hypothetical protein ABSE63_05910 [Thermoguttaceae bacterium]|jgi:ribosomal protein L37AE/L43A